MSAEQLIQKPDIKLSVKQTFGFDSDMNAGVFLSPDTSHELKPMNKRLMASHLLNHLVAML